jgi:transposase
VNDTTKQILTGLDQSGGNIRAVAEKFRVSESYVYRVKRNHWTDPTERDEQPAPTELQLAQKQMLATIAPNISDIKSLRDAALQKLQELVPSLEAQDLTKLLSALLRYETGVNALVQPALKVSDHRTQQQFILGDSLVERLSSARPEDLRALIDLPAPISLDEDETIDV